MTKFEELQAAHEHLMEQSKAPENVTDFVAEVQREIHNMCVAAEDIPAPRERDQLRAILRFWASYVYDKTGSYPDTTLRPAMSKGDSDSPPRSGGVSMDANMVAGGGYAVGRNVIGISLPSPLRRVLIITGVLTACVIVVVLLIVNKPPVYTPAPGAPAIPTKEISGAEAATSTQLLLIDSQVVTAGPSPFDPNVWAVRIQLSATGGDGHYIFWVNGQHLPDASRDQFTAEGKGCAEEHPFVGVTSGGQAASEELVITSPLPGCSTP